MDPQGRQMLQMHRQVQEVLQLGLPEVPWVSVLLAAGVSLTVIGYAVELYRKANGADAEMEGAQKPTAGKGSAKGDQPLSASAQRRQRLRARHDASGAAAASSAELETDTAELSQQESDQLDPYAGLQGEALLEALLTEGQKLKERRKLAEAEEVYEHANRVCADLAKQNPAHAIAYYSLGIRTLAALLTARGNHQRAVELHEQYVSVRY
jgi:tetratricopeptide (TPR) repeat protein